MRVISKDRCPLEIIYSYLLNMKDHDTKEKVYVDDVLQVRGEDGNPYPNLSPYKRVSFTWEGRVYYTIDQGLGWVIMVMNDLNL